MVFRKFKTRREAVRSLARVTPKSFGTPTRKLRKTVRRTKKGFTASVTLRRRK